MTAARKGRVGDIPELPDGCGYQGNEFGADYPDSICFGGRLYDADDGDFAPGGGFLYNTPATFIPCPQCNPKGRR